jgi:DNA-binding HxlR family transcriptional regulator
MTDAQIKPSLIALFHHKWAVPTLAALKALGGGAKFVTLHRKLGVGRESMKRTLEALGAMGLVMRNPGYGHPMRPEYVLTAKGKALAPACARLWKALEKFGAQQVALKKWALPALGALGKSGERFGEIGTALGAVTPRALAQILKDLQAAGMVERRLRDGTPPYAEYRPTKAGRKLGKRVAMLEEAMAAA